MIARSSMPSQGGGGESVDIEELVARLDTPDRREYLELMGRFQELLKSPSKNAREIRRVKKDIRELLLPHK